jgi:hypothetical protein
LQAKIRKNEQAPSDVALQPVSTILPETMTTATTPAVDALPVLPPASEPLKSVRDAVAAGPSSGPATNSALGPATNSAIGPAAVPAMTQPATAATTVPSGGDTAAAPQPAATAAELGRPQPIDLKVLSLTGSPGMVQWQVNGDTSWQIPLANDEVKGRFVIRTGPDAGCELMIDSSTRVRLGRLSRAEIRTSVESDETGTSKRSVIVLLRGVVYITPPAAGTSTAMPVLVKTPQMTIPITEPAQIVHDNAGTRRVSFTPESQPAASVPTP